MTEKNKEEIQQEAFSAMQKRQPGYLLETRGFPSPPHDGFGFIYEISPIIS
jgi:hypothetical protein